MCNFSVFPATETQAGIARIATAAEVADGVNDNTIITPAKLASALKGIHRIGKIEAVEYAPSELAEYMPGWYFCNGDTFALDSPQGVALAGLPDVYKERWGVTVDGSNISLPNMFYSDGRGYYVRYGDGTTKLIGAVEQDQIGAHNHLVGWPGNAVTTGSNIANFLRSDLSDTFATQSTGGAETSVLSIYKTPAIYLGVTS